MLMWKKKVTGHYFQQQNHRTPGRKSSGRPEIDVTTEVVVLVSSPPICDLPLTLKVSLSDSTPASVGF